MTDKYVRRNIVDAIQFDEKRYDSDEYDPDTYRTYAGELEDLGWCQELSEPYVAEHSDQPRSILGLTVYSHGRYTPIEDGDWIVRTGPNTIEVMDDAEFNYFYKKAD